MRYAFVFVFIVSTVLAQDVPETSVKKFPIPVDVELAYHRKVIAEVFGDRIKEARTIDEKSKLAEEMLGLAITAEFRFEQYALIEQAQELAIGAKNLTLAIRSIDLLDETFDVDKEQLRKQISEDLAEGSERNATVIKQFEVLDAMVKEDPSKIYGVADACYTLAQKLRGPFQQSAKDRAIKYYKLAIPELKGIEKMKAEGRIEELKKMQQGTKSSSRQKKKDMDLECLTGTWKIQYWPNRVWRTYKFNARGEVYYQEGNYSGMVVQKDGDILLDFNNINFERLNLSGHRIFIEHFHPKSNFPVTPDQIGIGTKVEENSSIRITAKIDGTDEVHINKLAAFWKHHSWNDPADVQINGQPWDIKTSSTLNHSPAMQNITRSLDFATATITISKGRGNVSIMPFPDHVKVIFDDHQLGAGEYDVTIIFSEGQRP